MDAKLRYVEIKKLFGQYDVEWNIEKDTTVLVGQNGSGKTTILKIIMCALLKESLQNELLHSVKSLLESCVLDFLNDRKVTMVCGRELGDIKTKTLIDHLSDRILKTKPGTKEYDSLSEILSELNSLIISKDLDGMIARQAHNISLKNIHLEFISTLNMSANAINSVVASDGKSFNILDIEIDQVINTFQKLKKQKKYIDIKRKIVHVLNDFFSTTQKTIELSDTDFVIKNLKQEALKLSQLSAGERQIIYIVFKVATAYFNEALILMDEPEISLHLEWQEKLLKNLREINDKSQMIVVTHSPAIIMDGWMDSYVDIQTILKPIKDDE